MARNTYQDKLDELRGDVGAMADLTLERYDTAVHVLESGDEASAREVITGDAEINDWYLDLESDCVELIALQQPVATDLRFITSSFKIVTDLERIGDLATNLAAYGREADGELTGMVDLGPIVAEAGGMVEDAMAAYARGDAGTAREIATRDDRLDDRCKQASEAVVRTLLTTEMEAADVEAILEDVSRALLTIRDLERIGDHAVNICARTVYMVENDDELLY